MEQKKLPDAEFEIMKAIWQMQEPVTSALITAQLRRIPSAKDWKPQTILTMLTRLEQKGFLRSEKHGRERAYYVLIPQAEYLQIEANSLRQRFSGGRFAGLVKALCDTDDLTAADIADLQRWLNERSGQS
ncbi:MAG: BlaI/MecI/CopY family transcriptional regulator [Oscillospiraceae bacterium]|nr:BlaI/MecI/CopY family transcriptional regulator [Oscillospiraceae bacterium]MBQ5338214.1 BlaI/MecI/CopY family transcriptional regulator [Oscillospiraceae bacterium]MBQ9908098.1 BlaI/MecI/CopY family transcriptional regulator [Oscillospiraceae bacterium]MBR5364460.1 BlaI/MecI/CopY family transcriptional regulator [Oscillospiraceae bacterium]